MAEQPGHVPPPHCTPGQPSGRMDDMTNFEIWFVLTVIVTPVVWYVIVKAINRSETPTVE